MRSPTGSSDRSAFSSSSVGMIAWWSDTFLSFTSRDTSGKNSPHPSKGGTLAARWRTAEAVSAMSAVRYRLSVRGIGQQLLLVQGLRVVPASASPCSRTPGLPPAGGWSGRRAWAATLSFCSRVTEAQTASAPAQAAPQGLRLRRGGDPLADRLGPAQSQAHMVVLLFAEHCDFAVPVHQHGKGGRLHPPYIQGAVVEDGEQPGGVDPDEPVGFLAAEGGLIQRVILGAGAQVSEAPPGSPRPPSRRSTDGRRASGIPPSHRPAGR